MFGCLVKCFRCLVAKDKKLMSKPANYDSTAPPPRRFHLLIGAVGFLVFAVYGSLVPLQYRALALDDAIEQFRKVPYLRLDLSARADWVSNILLFVPLGFLCLGVWAVDRRNNYLAIFKMAFVGVGCFLLSVTIEFTQLWFPPRTVSQNDIVAESIGGLLGAALWLVVGQTLIDWLREYHVQQRKRRIDWLLEAYFIGLVIYQVLPLDLTISISELWQKLKSGRVVLIPFADLQLNYHGLYGMFRDVMIHVPLGAMVGVYRVPAGRLRNWSGALLLGGLIVAGIECLQIIIYSRFTSTTDVLLGTAGVALGYWIIRQVQLSRSSISVQCPVKFGGETVPTGIVRPAVLGMVYACFLVGIFCAPFDFTRDKVHLRQAYEGFFSIPFARLYHGSEFNAISSALANIILFAPLGCLAVVMAVAMTMRTGQQLIVLAIAWLLIVGLAIGIELLQIFLPSHFADVTEVIVRCLGGGLGIGIAYQYARPDFANRYHRNS